MSLIGFCAFIFLFVLLAGLLLFFADRFLRKNQKEREEEFLKTYTIIRDLNYKRKD